jgi:GNAT superfamily N-acetyltransferase
MAGVDDERYDDQRGLEIIAAMNINRDVRISQADDEASVRRCWAAFSELRPHLDEAEFIRRWQTQQAEGYRIIYIETSSGVVAAAGFRTLNTMAWGKIIYLDDLVALGSEHGRGWGTRLLQWLQKLAAQGGFSGVHLDTGYQRLAAHKAYLRNGFHLNCHHLAWNSTAE